jgi:hypothetical protein
VGAARARLFNGATFTQVRDTLGGRMSSTVLHVDDSQFKA